jgi:hypothetical protein
VTGLLTTCGQEFQDWSAPYRVFCRDRLPIAEIFSVVRRGVLAELPPQAPLCVAIDDSLLRKAGLRIPGVAWRRDPLGPHFQTNFVRAQRVLQLSASLPLSNHGYRMVPIAFRHAPTPAKPSRKASPEEFQQYRQAARQARLPLLAAQQIGALRQALDAEPGGTQRQLQILVDGGYTNATVLKKLPPRTTLIGRLRKDAKLYFLPQTPAAPQPRGRPRRYGAPAPTPEQLRTDDSVPWTSLEVSVSGAPHSIRIRYLRKILWRTAGLGHTLQRVVIAPLSYRLRKGSKLLYRQPAFLICTDPELDLRTLVQGYVQRWGIGVSSQGHIVQSVKDRPRPRDSGLVAGEAPWRESQTAKPSDNMLGKEYAQRTRLQRAVNADVASLHESPVAETVDNARKQQGLAETSPMRQLSPAGYQRRHGVKEDVETGEALGARRRNLVEEMPAITVSGKCWHRHQGGGSGRSTVDGRAAKRARREGPGPVSIPFVKERQG